MAVEKRRGCGYRKVGGIYLVTDGPGVSCDRLPIPLTVCPVCSHGIKQSRGWTWVDVAGLVGGDHTSCEDIYPCPICMDTVSMGRAGLLWVGGRFYKRPSDFVAEAHEMGISRRVATVPRGFEAGKTWILFAHHQTVLCGACAGAGTVHGEPCVDCQAHGKRPGLFYVARPCRVEIIVTESQSKDAEYMESITKRKLTPVIVPDNDTDHQGTVYDAENETEEIDAA